MLGAVGQRMRPARCTKGSDMAITNRSRMRWAVLAAATLVGGVVLLPGAASASGVYTGSGYDISYPNCTVTSAFPATDFAIIGLGGGRPFTTSKCLGSEWKNNSTQPDESLYFNTGYAGAYAKNITTACQNESSNAPIPAGTPSHTARTETQAWEIGCSEADFASSKAPGTPAAWWADIETGNSWSTNTGLNDFAIDGIVYQMSTLKTTGGAPAGGIYSTPSNWAQIAGSGFVAYPAIQADWEPVPTNSSVAATCSTAFSLTSTNSYSPVWVVQYGSVNGVDGDVAC